MTTTLVSFLGKARQGGNYQETTYAFEGAQRKSKYFGLALAEHLKPGKLVLLGTAGSMWDVLLDSLGQGDAALELLENAEKNAITQQQLDAIAPLLSQHMNLQCELKIIPYGRDDAEQTEILRVIADAFAQDDLAVLDLTHGFRHLPMLGLMSAFYLEIVRQVKIEAMYYGALDMTENGITPVLRLDGLLRMAGWLRALHSYDKDGDYGVFAPLLENIGLNGKALGEAAYYERTSNPAMAREKLNTVQTQKLETDDPVGSLFLPALEKRLEWRKLPDRAQWEKHLANAYLEKGDYVRAAIYGFEGNITAQIARDAPGAINDYDRREAVKNQALEAEKGKDKNDKNVTRLNALRNALAHGVRAKHDDTLSIIKDQKTLRETLQKLFKKLLGG